MSLATLIPALLNVIASVLESLFVANDRDSRTRKKRDRSSSSRDRFHHVDSDRLDDDDERGSSCVRAACEFFGTTPEEATRESIRKKWKKLSLLHHPDRNGNSDESVEMMQRLNFCHEILEREFDRREGVVDADDGIKDEEGAPFRADGWRGRPRSEGFEEARFDEENLRGPKKKKKRRRRREAERKRRSDMEREMRKEWAEIERRRIELQQKKKAMKRANRMKSRKEGLDTKEGRDRANDAWEEAVRRRAKDDPTAEEEEDDDGTAATEPTSPEGVDGSLHDIDEDDPPCASDDASKPPSKPKPPSAIPVASAKPVIPVMEYSLDDVAIALRMGLPEVAIDAMQDGLKTAANAGLKKAFLARGSDPGEAVDEAVRDYLSRRLDDDGNAILHYAVYYETSDVVDFVAYLARQCESFPEIMLRTNDRGQRASDFAECCTRDPSIPDRMKALTDAAREELADAQFVPSLAKTGQKFWDVARNVTLLPVVNTVLSYLVGTRLFGCWRVTSIVACVWCQGPPDDDRHDCDAETDDRETASFLFATHITWWIFRLVGRALCRALHVELCLLLVPVGILYCCAENQTHQRGPDWVNVLLFPMTCATILLQLLSNGLLRSSFQIRLPGALIGVGLERCVLLALFSGVCGAVRMLVARLPSLMDPSGKSVAEGF